MGRQILGGEGGGGLDLGKGGVQGGAGPRLSTHTAREGLGGRAQAQDLLGRGEAAHQERGFWSVEFWNLEVTSSVRVFQWGLGPARLEGVSEGVSECQVPRVEVGPCMWVQGQGLGSVWQEGGFEGRGLGLGAQQAPWCPNGQGKHQPCSLPFLHPWRVSLMLLDP